jgi:hypothetical protein
MFALEYKLLNSIGWANAVVTVGPVTQEIGVSYLSDPLMDLAWAALISLEPEERKGSAPDCAGQIWFGCEPAGLQLRVVDELTGLFAFNHYKEKDMVDLRDPRERSLDLILGYSEDWYTEKPEIKPLSQSRVTVFEFATKVYGLLGSVLDEVGVTTYRAKWYESFFPLTEFAQLGMHLGQPSKTVKLW